MKRPITRRRVITGAVAMAAAPIALATRLRADQPTVHSVQIKAFKFEPDILNVKSGDIIRWTNADLAPHTATADEFGWDTGPLAKGESGEVTVITDMETSYFCVFHPHMKALIKIS